MDSGAARSPNTRVMHGPLSVSTAWSSQAVKWSACRRDLVELEAGRGRVDGCQQHNGAFPATSLLYTMKYGRAVVVERSLANGRATVCSCVWGRCVGVCVRLCVCIYMYMSTCLCIAPTHTTMHEHVCVRARPVQSTMLCTWGHTHREGAAADAFASTATAVSSSTCRTSMARPRGSGATRLGNCGNAPRATFCTLPTAIHLQLLLYGHAEGKGSTAIAFS